MDHYLEKLPSFVDEIRAIRETIITNIVLIGQIPAPTFKEQARAKVFLERISDCHADECTTDGYQNPVGIIRGTNPAKPPVFLVAHLDNFFSEDIEHNYTIRGNSITGAGILDNSVSVGVLASLPEIFRKLNLSFESDIVIAGVVQSIGKGNLRGIRKLLNLWPSPIRGAVCVEGCDLGRLNYYSHGMIRCNLDCNISSRTSWDARFRPNAILVVNEVVNQILKMRLPQRPMSRVIFGKISGCIKHGLIAYDAKLGFEIQSTSDAMVQSMMNEIADMTSGISHEYGVDINLKTISSLSASRLKYNHPLVKNTALIMEKLGITPVSEHSMSELSIFLAKNIPAVTLGITKGKNYHLENSSMLIEPMFKGIAQIIGVIMAIDSGVCDE